MGGSDVASDGGGLVEGGRASLWTMVIPTLTLALAIFANAWKGDLKVGEVSVHGNSIVPSTTIVSLSGIARKSGLFDVDLYGVQQRVLENPFVKSVSVQRETPARIAMRVVERMPVAAIAVGKIQFIDEEGFVLPSILADEIFDLPVVTGRILAGEIVPGKRIDSEPMKDVIAVLGAMRAVGEVIYRRASEIHITDDGEITLYTTDGALPVLVGKGDYGRKLVTLAAFWNQIAMREDIFKMEEVDLRYSGQVVVRWKKGSAPDPGSLLPIRNEGEMDFSSTSNDSYI